MNNFNIDSFTLPQAAIEAGARDDIKKMQFASNDGVTTMSGFQKDGIPYRFFMYSEYNERKSFEAGFEVYDEHECVEFMRSRKTKPTVLLQFLGNDRLRRNIRGEYVGGSMFEDYQRWKSGLGAKGLPLDRWDVPTPSQIKTLNSENIFTVDQLSSIDETIFKEIFGRSEEFLALFERAKLWQGNKEIESKAKEQLEEIQSMREQMEAMKAEMEAMKAESVVKPKAKRNAGSKSKSQAKNKLVKE